MLMVFILLHKCIVEKCEGYGIFAIECKIRTNFGKLMFGQDRSNAVKFSLKQVQGEPAGKTLISDLPTGGSADHVDQRGV